MKSKGLGKKPISDFSYRDEAPKGRVLSVEKSKRSKKPSIYDELDEEDDYYFNHEDDLVDGYKDDDDDDNRY
jgi:hypothetical protein